MADYSTSKGRPLTSWSDLMVSHTAYENWKENDKTERYFSFFSDLKQWAGHPNHRVRVRDDKGKEIDLPPYEELKEGDMDPIELYAYYIGQRIQINRYRLNSTSYRMKGVTIPAFCGSVSLRSSLPPAMAELLRLLMLFAPYCGVGVKTSLGMGGVASAAVTRSNGKESL